jgi:hypothetical protein
MIKGRSRNTRHQPHEKRHAMRMWAGRLTGLPASSLEIPQRAHVRLSRLSSLFHRINRAFRGNTKRISIDRPFLICHDKSIWQTEAVVKRSKCTALSDHAEPNVYVQFRYCCCVGFSLIVVPHLLAGGVHRPISSRTSRRIGM